MAKTMLNIGNDYKVNADSIAAIMPYSGARIKNTIQYKRQQDNENPDGTFVDATYGKKTLSVILCDDGQYILSSVAPKTLAKRFSAIGNSR